MAILKYQPEDFIVKEIKGYNESTSGTLVYLLKKRNYTTERAVSQIANSLHIPRKFIGYAGTKDKNAITHQYISIKKASKEKINSLKLKDIELDFVGFTDNEIKLGDLKGNSFEIILRDLPNDFNLNISNNFLVPNYFDEQRFSNANLEIGILLLQNKFNEAIDLISKTDGDFSEKIIKHLDKQKNDFIGALKLLPKKTILFYIHSVQSYFFNEILANNIKQNNEHIQTYNYSQGTFIFSNNYNNLKELPLIGYLLSDYDNILIEKQINHRNFLIRSLPEFSLEGSFREAFFKVEDFNFKVEDDDLFPSKKKCIISFNLESGSYATIVLKSLLAQKHLELMELKINKK